MVKKELDPQKEIENIVRFIQNYFVNNGNSNTKAVIGISGGKDSTVAAALLVRALGKDRVVGVMMPNGEQADLADAQRVCTILGIPNYTMNIGNTCANLLDGFVLQTGLPLSDQITTNTPARLRMTVLYMIANAVGGRVCNTGNASEFFIGYTTKYGDLAGDFALFRDYTVSDIYKLGEALGLPFDLIYKTPADGMSGMSDEEKTGVPYSAIDAYLFSNKHPEDMAVFEKMMNMHKRNKHKEVVNLPYPQRFNGFLNRPYEEGFCF